jgi:hypothetical protein
VFFHVFGAATLGKSALALGILASAYGAGSALASSEQRMPSPAAKEIARPQTTPNPTPATVATTTSLSFEALLDECVARYKRGATNTKEACEAAIAASGLSTDAFVAKYRSLLVPPATKTEKPAPTATPHTTVSTTASFEALLSECVARYKRGASNTKEACDRAIAASGLSTDAFFAKYRSLLVPSTKTETAKPTATTKPTAAPKLNTSDPKVQACLAKYEMLKTLKTSEPQTFEAALKYFTETCKSVLAARG